MGQRMNAIVTALLVIVFLFGGFSYYYCTRYTAIIEHPVAWCEDVRQGQQEFSEHVQTVTRNANP